MKFGLSLCYWLEYIYQAYMGANADAAAIFLVGVPDKGDTRPYYGDFYPSQLLEYQENK